MRIYVLKHRKSGVEIHFPENYFKENYNEKTNQIFFAVYGRNDKELFLKLSDYNVFIRNKEVLL